MATNAMNVASEIARTRVAFGNGWAACARSAARYGLRIASAFAQAEVAHALGYDPSREGMSRAAAKPAQSELDRLVTLIEVSRALTAELDPQEIIQRILEGAIRVIPAAEAGLLFLYDAERRALVVNHAIGFGPGVYDLIVKPGEGLSGRAFLNRHAEIYPHKEDVAAVMGAAQPSNLDTFREASGGTDYPQSAVSAPLVYKGEALGAMVVENFYKPEVFRSFDVQLLDALAQAAAVAIVNARLYAAEHASRLRLEALNEEIRSQRDQLERRLQVQDSLAEVVRDDLPLGALATRLARITRASVFLSDALYRLRACDVAVTAETLRELDAASWTALQPVLRQAAETRAQQRLNVENGRELLICPVSAGLETLGFVILDARHRQLDVVDAAAADSAAMIAAAKFLRERALEEGEIRRRGDVLERLLRGEVPSGADALRQIQPPLRLVVGTLRPHGDGQPNSALRVLRTFLALTQEALSAEGRPVTVTLKDGYVVAIQSLAGRPADDGPSFTVLEQAAERLKRLAPEWRAVYAVEDEVGELAGLAAAHHEARLAIEVRERLGRIQPVLRVRSLGAYRLILRAASGADIVQLCQRTLGAVIEHDRRRSSALLDTFRIYLDAGASIKEASIRLGVHPHTVEYRLDRLQELSGLSLRRAEDRLTLELALRILDAGRVL